LIAHITKVGSNKRSIFSTSVHFDFKMAWLV
jgi:hypothetical protein